MSSPRSIAGRLLLDKADVPEPGTWFRTDDDLDGVPIVVRVPSEEEGHHEDADAIEVAYERIRHLAHPSLPRVVGFERVTGSLLLAVEAGVPLSRLLDHRHEPSFSMTPATVLDVGTQLAELIVHAHEHGRPHGHLSPEVVWVTETGRLVVWGFGPGPDHLGNTRWWAPERARGKRASGDADQWAICAIIASLVSGRVPWRGDDPVAEARIGDASHLIQPVLDQWKPLGRLVERGLASEPRDRFPSVHPLRQGLDAMHQRVSHGSDLASMGVELLERYGPAPLEVPTHVDPEDAPSPRAFVGAVVPSVLDDEPATTVSSEPPPLDALGDSPVSPLVVPEAIRAEDPTDFMTNPTRIPDAGERDDEGLPMVDAHLDDDPDSVGSLPSLGGASAGGAWGDAPEPVGLAARAAGDADAPLVWYEKLPVLTLAPYTVGALAVTLVLYACLLLVGLCQG